MDILDTRIDVTSETYQANYAAMTALVEDLKKELDTAMNSRSPKALDRHRESGKIPAQKKLDLLLDRNTPFLEIAPLAAKDQYGERSTRRGSWPVSAWSAGRSAW